MLDFELSNLGSKSVFYSLMTVENAPSWLTKANFSRTQTDLIATSPEGEEAVFIDYFTNFDLPNIQTENGLLLKGSLLKALAGPLAKGQYAQATGDGALSIGEVSSVSGVVKATRLDGNIFELSVGDPVFQGDTVETEGSGAVGLVFLDKTTLSLSEGGKMVLDELVYDPASGTGSMAVDMVEGAFSFVSGEIAKTGPDAMQVSTPVATIGIRGTTVAGKAAVEGNENAFTLLQDADGGVGQISISNDGGTQVLAQVGATTTVSSFTAPPPPPVILSAAQIQANYGTALNVLPPTPVVAPTPQPPPPPQEQQQEQQVQEEASEEEGSEEEVVSEEATTEEEGEGPPEGEEGPIEGEGPPEGEGLPEGEEGLEGEGPLEGEEGPPVGEEGSGPEEQVAAREAFDTALAAGASPEEAMAEAAAAAGIEGELPGGSGDIPLGGGPLDGAVNAPLGMPGMDPFGSGPGLPGSPVPGMGPVDPAIAVGIGGPNMGPAFGPGPADMFAGGPMVGPVFGPMSGPDDIMGGGLMGPVFGPMGPGSGFNPNEASLNPYGNAPEPIIEFFEDPSLYDDYRQNEQEEASQISSSSTSTTYNGTASDDTIDKSTETNSVVINGLGGNDTLKGGSNDDTINGGNGIDQLTGGGGSDNFYLDGTTSFGDTIKDFTLNDTLTINFTFDLPTAQYSVTRSHFYTHNSTDRLTYNSSSNSNELPYIFNFTDDVSTYLSKSFRSEVVSSIRYTKAQGGNGTEQLLIVGDGTNSAIWLWDDLSEGYGVSTNELTFVAELENFNNDTLTGSEIVFSSL